MLVPLIYYLAGSFCQQCGFSGYIRADRHDACILAKKCILTTINNSDDGQDATALLSEFNVAA